MPIVDRDQFMRDGYLILRDVIPAHELKQLRASYEIILEKQKVVWRRERGPGDPPGGQWDTARQPRITGTESLIDASTGNAVEVWLSESTLGVAEQLLNQPVAGIQQMMVMCNPTFEYGPANWHRDVHPIDMGPMRSMQESLIENGPNYVQWNIPLYDDDVFWVVPGSHTRLNTDEEHQQLLKDPCVPLPGGVRVGVKAGDALVYSNYLLHWGSSYTAKVLRRTLHGGHTTYPNWEDIRFTRHLSAKSRELFGSWVDRTAELKDATESCLRAVLDKDRSAYLSGLEVIHPGAGPAGKFLVTIWLCKAARHCYLLRGAGSDKLQDEAEGMYRTERNLARAEHSISLNWGPQLAERFSKAEADAIWDGFAELEQHLRTANGKDYVPGYQSGPILYYLEQMRSKFDLNGFLSTWHPT